MLCCLRPKVEKFGPRVQGLHLLAESFNFFIERLFSRAENWICKSCCLELRLEPLTLVESTAGPSGKDGLLLGAHEELVYGAPRLCWILVDHAGLHQIFVKPWNWRTLHHIENLHVESQAFDFSIAHALVTM